MIVTVYNTETKEVMASIDTEKEDDCGFSAKGISVSMTEYEPLFRMIENRLYFDEDRFIVNL